jgi:iron-sulfur cluster assembly accessory protein
MKVDVDFKVTDAAIIEFKRAIQESSPESEVLVRVLVDSGCSGLMYGLNFVGLEEVTPNDIVDDFGGVKIVADKRALFQLDGTTVDWVDDPNGKGFKFNNPFVETKSCCRKSS